MAKAVKKGDSLKDRLRALTAELMLIPGLSGYEGRVRRRIAAKLRALGIASHSDRLGNLIATLPGAKDAPSVMLFAHMDQLGLVVRKIEANGLIRVERLGGVPERIVHDNDTSIVAEGAGKRARLHPEVSALLGQLHTKVVPLAPRRPTSKGGVERTIGYLETSFLPLRSFASLADLQVQHDAWAAEVAYGRMLRRTGARVGDRWAVERGFLHRLPEPLPDTDLHLEARAGKDAFVRVLSADYSVPPTFVGRRIGVRVTPTEVRLSCEGTPIATHRRSFVRADVVLAPAHGRAIRLAREARDRLAEGEPEAPVVDLARYDRLFEVPA